MNTVTEFLRTRCESVPYLESVNPNELSCLLVTPRFRASSHVLFFVLTEDRTDPLLVAKIPRLANDTSQLDREVANLRAAEVLFANSDSIPKVLFYEDYGGHRLLIETALPGRPLKASQIRRHPGTMIESVLGWLIDFHRASARSSNDVTDWYDTLIETALLHLERLFPEGSAESSWIRGTRRLLEPLRNSGLCLVFEHGDYSSPNILLDDHDSIGVVDWELAEKDGLPALDAFFFLNFAAFSKSRARSNEQYVDAFRNAFFGADGWALPYLREYCLKLNLDRNVLRPLFVFCWARYVANLAVRLRKSPDSNAMLSDESISWLRQNRYYKLWEYALKNSECLSFNADGAG